MSRVTTLHHVEVYANTHDDFQFIGGTVNTKYLTANFSGDDAFDYTVGDWHKNIFLRYAFGADTGFIGQTETDR